MKIIITENQFKNIVSDIEEDLTQYKEGNLKVIYRDNIVSVVVPISPEASAVTCRGTQWCSRDPEMFKHWGQHNILFRFLFKDGYKLRLTWEFNRKGGHDFHFSWGSGGKKYSEINDYGNPFIQTEKWKKDILNDFKKYTIDNIDYNPDRKHFDYDLDKEVTNQEYYENWRDVKLEIIKRIKMIPQQAISTVNEYRYKLLIQK